MMKIQFLSLAIFVTSVIQGSLCFASVSKGGTAVKTLCLAMPPGSDDPTKVWYAGFADAVQNVLTNSPLNEGKKALVKSLAGEYDEAAIKAKLNTLIDENSVLMLSFVK
jgi:hypothetical protein